MAEKPIRIHYFAVYELFRVKTGEPVFEVYSRRREMRNCESERIPPDKAVELLRKDGIEVTEEQAKVILEFLYEMAGIVVDQYLAKPV